MTSVLKYLSASHFKRLGGQAAFSGMAVNDVGLEATKLIRPTDIPLFYNIKGVSDEAILAYVADSVFGLLGEEPSVHPRMMDFLQFMHFLFLHARVKHDTSKSEQYYSRALDFYRSAAEAERYSSPISF